jgi:arginyl-tRNA synthetase
VTAVIASRGERPARTDAETVVIDYSGPNVAKEMHVGHMRSTVIGDSLARVLEHVGHRVIRQNHVGDWGTPFGMLIEHMIDLGAQAAASQRSLGELKAFYQDARAKFDADPSFAERSRQRVVALQAGDTATLELWRVLVDQSKQYFEKVYDLLGILLTDADLRGESFYNPLLGDVALELEQKGLARVDGGALCVFVDGFAARDGSPLPLIIRKSDGGYGYATTDLAGIRYRTQVLGATRVLYVVGAPQQQHLAMVFAVARAAGWLPDGARAEHVAFGSILGKDRKMLRTRSGGSERLIDLLEEAVARADRAVQEKNADLDSETRARVARSVGIGALKYVDLSSDRIKDYVFDWDRMLAFEGNTGPYLQYAHARIQSIFRRGEVAPDGRASAVTLSEPAERALALELLGFPDVIESVAESLEPHQLCGYLYELATRFSVFFEQCPVLKSEGSTRASRLALCGQTAHVLATGLGLLGMDAPDRM